MTVVITNEGPCHVEWQGLVVSFGRAMSFRASPFVTSSESLCHFERSREIYFFKKIFGDSDFCRIFAIPFHVNVFEILRK